MPDNNPYEAPLHKTNLPGEPRSWVGRIFTILGILFACLLVAALLLPMFWRGRGGAPAYRAGCINNIRQIQLAVLNYESANGELPPAYTVDEDGNRLHSWRTLILPYIEEAALYDSIDLTKPWDDPVNAKAREAVVYSYMCPAASHDESKTTYMAIVGPGHVFSGPEANKFDQFPDASQWMAIMEIPSEAAVHWMSPYDADEELLQQLSETSEFSHDAVFVVAFLDNHILGYPIDQLDKFRDSVPKLSREVQDTL